MKVLKKLSGVFTISTVLFSITLYTDICRSQIIGPSSEEVKYSYVAEFDIPTTADEQTDQDRVHLHASHLFGLFHTPTMVNKFGLRADSGGLGGPRSQMNLKILSSTKNQDTIHIKYSNSGKMILHTTAAKKILEQGILEVPLPLNPYKIYDEKCTDSHYTSFGDFWYFYDPFRSGCEHLSQPPYSANVQIKIQPVLYKKMQKMSQLPFLRGDNGNGDLFSIYVIHGFESDDKAKDDSGRANFKDFNDYLRKNNFVEDKIRSNKSSSYYVYTKELTLQDGKKINVEIKHLLLTTSIGSKSKLFANYFKEAVENADVIIYGGHSGLGGNLDIPSLEAKAGAFKFNPNKKQVFFFDSCSSYSYYLEHFAVEKTKSKIDIITNGLSSYFHTSPLVLNAFIDELLDPNTKDKSWAEVLQKMEEPLQGDSYLLNVGGL